MIDLHIHSIHSDGKKSVKEILEMAENINAKYISITDHETCDAHKEIRENNLASIFSGEIITGIELKSCYKNRIVDILGYNIDTNKMNNWLNTFYKGTTRADLQTKYIKKHYETCKKLGIKITPYNELEWNPAHDWANIIAYREIKKYEENEKKLPKDLWENVNNFRQKYCNNPSSIFYIDRAADFPDIDVCIKAIKESDGLAFMAHPFMYKWVINKEKFVEELVSNHPIDGVECYYSEFSKEQTQFLLDLCERKGLYKSGGTDYHGIESIHVEIGKGYGNLSIPDNLIKDWVKQKECV